MRLTIARVFMHTSLILTFASCGTMQVRHRNDDALSAIKRIAVVAYESHQPKSASSVVGAAETSPVIDASYDALLKKLRESLGWEPISRLDLKKNPGYAAAHEQTMVGIQNKTPPPEGTRTHLISGIMDYQSARILGKDGRSKLIRSLGVDAVMAIRVDIDLEGTTVMGIGNRYPRARLSFQIFNLDEEAPIWFDGKVEGEQSKSSVGKTAFFDDELLTRLGAESAITAYSKIQSTEI